MRRDLSIYKQKITKQPVGYCHCRAHKGALTVNLMKKHGCLSKCCNCLQKNQDHPYWAERALKKTHKKETKKQFNAMIWGN